MKTLIIYDSFFGNTEQIARKMGSALTAQDEVEVCRVSEVKPEQIRGAGLLIAGSPTRGFRPSKATSDFLKSLPTGDLNGVKVAAFDTRISPEDSGSAILKFFVSIFGYAAKPIAEGLKRKGGELVKEPEGFYVEKSEGPLKAGELERAAQWADLVHAACV